MIIHLSLILRSATLKGLQIILHYTNHSITYVEEMKEEMREEMRPLREEYESFDEWGYKLNIVMLFLALLFLLAAVALPSVHATTALLTRTTTLTLIASAAMAANVLCLPAMEYGVTAYSGLLNVTPVALSADVLILLAGAVAILPWAASTISVKSITGSVLTTLPTISTYPLFVLFTTIGATLLLSSGDLITVYLSIELQSFAVYVLAALYRDSETATHAGLLYFLLGGLSSSLILLGSALIYADTGHTNIDSIMTILAVQDTGNAVLGTTTVGFIVMTIGFLFKVSAAPLHNWAPDVYDGVPTIVTTWLAVLPKISILALLLELQSGLGGATTVLIGNISYDAWTSLLLVTSLLSLIIGTVVGLAQSRVKRLLAYSTISHVGFLLLALSVHSEEGVEAYIFYLGQYTATALTSFLTLLAIGYVLQASNNLIRTTDVSYVNELAGIFRTAPLLALSFGVCLFSIAGVPPLIGFFGKQAVLYTAIHSGYTFMALIAIVVSVISASYYLRVVRVIYFDASVANTNVTIVPITAIHSYVLATLTLALTLFLADPNLVLDSARLLALTLYQT